MHWCMVCRVRLPAARCPQSLQTAQSKGSDAPAELTLAGDGAVLGMLSYARCRHDKGRAGLRISQAHPARDHQQRETQISKNCLVCRQ